MALGLISQGHEVQIAAPVQFDAMVRERGVALLSYEPRAPPRLFCSSTVTILSRDATKDDEALTQVMRAGPVQPFHETTYLFAARALRDLGDGFVAILLPAYLLALGFAPFSLVS